MRVVIAGSSGLIGTSLTAALRRGGHEVLRLVRRAPSSHDEVRWDPAGAGVDPAVFKAVDGIVNLCGVGIGDKRWTGAYKQAIRDSRITPTDVLARAAAAAGVPVLVSASGINFYGDTGNHVVDETAPAGEGFLAHVCRDWEGATAPASAAGVRVVLLRTSVVLAPSGGMLGKLNLLYKCGLGGKLGTGTQYFPWISLTDQVDAIVFALEHDTVSGPINLAGPTPVTNAEFNSAMGRAYGRPAPWKVPGFVISAVIGEFADEAILAGPRAVPAALQKAGFTFTHRTVDDALAAAVGRP